MTTATSCLVANTLRAHALLVAQACCRVHDGPAAPRQLTANMPTTAQQQTRNNRLQSSSRRRHVGAYLHPNIAQHPEEQPRVGLESLLPLTHHTSHVTCHTMVSMRVALISFTMASGCASRSLNTDSMTDISVDVVSRPQNALQSFTTRPAPMTSEPRLMVPATSGTWRAGTQQRKHSKAAQGWMWGVGVWSWWWGGESWCKTAEQSPAQPCHTKVAPRSALAAAAAYAHHCGSSLPA